MAMDGSVRRPIKNLRKTRHSLMWQMEASSVLSAMKRSIKLLAGDQIAVPAPLHSPVAETQFGEESKLSHL